MYTLIIYPKERYQYGDLEVDSNIVLQLGVSTILQRLLDSTVRRCGQICCFACDAEAVVSMKVMEILTSLATVVFSFPETTLRRGLP
jgi:hypothetical protein